MTSSATILGRCVDLPPLASQQHRGRARKAGGGAWVRLPLRVWLQHQILNAFLTRVATMIIHIQQIFQPIGVRGGQCDDPSYHANRELCYGSSAREHRGGPASFRPPPRASPSASVSAWKYDGCSQAALNGGESSRVTATATTHVPRMAVLVVVTHFLTPCAVEILVQSTTIAATFTVVHSIHHRRIIAHPMHRTHLHRRSWNG